MDKHRKRSRRGYNIQKQAAFAFFHSTLFIKGTPALFLRRGGKKNGR